MVGDQGNAIRYGPVAQSVSDFGWRTDKREPRRELAEYDRDREQIQAESTSAPDPVAAPEPEALAVSDIAWGDDSGDYANDGACDDARFEADGDDWTYQRSHVLRDSTDCRTLYEQGTLTLFLDFGSNNGDYVDDNTCDDNRFTGEGRSILQTDSQVKRDAADCIAAYQAGTINRPT
mgnify:CR=1 FL=1